MRTTYQTSEFLVTSDFTSEFPTELPAHNLWCQPDTQGCVKDKSASHKADAPGGAQVTHAALGDFRIELFKDFRIEDVWFE